jgi:hypothetical protein
VTMNLVSALEHLRHAIASECSRHGVCMDPKKKCLGEIAVGTFNAECLLKRAPSARLAW